MADKKEYRIRVAGVLVEVTQEVYLAYYRMKRREQFLIEKDMEHGVELYSNLDTDETLGEEMLPDRYSPGVEEKVITEVLSEKLRRCIDRLPEVEKKLIRAIYYEGTSERQLSRQTGIPQMTINSRKRKILAKLKKSLEN